MLQVKNIVKTYITGDVRQDALKGVSVNFRDNEFVSILGHSGSGKTTLLNIIGGLDRYTSGDLIINGVSTTKYKDADWDVYRNHKIGFVFQSYNLIPHQTVLANVEMALTLSGVPQKERKARAAEALKKVGLAEHMHKKPNQMSGGQMQRVAIARALVNNPDILLADEPTGALDTETSIQIMELLKEIARDKLVIMVTHNPELAEQYSTRIVRLQDGLIIDDTDPLNDCDEPTEPKKQKKVSMSFLTALSLSFNNLRTKKGRTLLTAFAGSIGIIGIALILALSTGMNAYIAGIQKETMTAYPISIQSETFSLSSLSGLRDQLAGSNDENLSGIYADFTALKAGEALIQQNNLSAFKAYLDDEDSEIRQYLGETGVIYGYDISFSVFSHNPDGRLIDSSTDPDEGDQTGFFGSFSSMRSSGGGADNFSELMVGSNGAMISQVTTDSYELLYGTWPENYDEVVLVLDQNNSVSAKALYQLGFVTEDQYQAAVKSIENGSDAEEIRFDYASACGHSFYLVPACDFYLQNENGTFSKIDDVILQQDALLEHAVELKISAVIRPIAGASNADISTAVAYTSALTDVIIEHTANSPIVTAQMKTQDINVLNGLPFATSSDEEKVSMTRAYIGSLGVSEKASLYKMILYYQAGSASEDGTSPGAGQGYSGQMTEIPDDAGLATMLDYWLVGDPDPEIMLGLYDQYIGGSSYADNMAAFGSVSYDAPSSISIYADNFEDKEAISDCITAYNNSVAEDARITYTDYVARMTSGLTTIINGISYVLIAFVAVSLIVSCIMIGIITHISVMERTKEIGILRALGASKGNISQVFNAETFIIGCCSGLLGIGITLALLVPINSVISRLSGVDGLSAQLPVSSAVILIVLSIVITILGGLLPAKRAAKKDPVIALRTE